jgi:hypothetical protein
MEGFGKKPPAGTRQASGVSGAGAMGLPLLSSPKRCSEVAYVWTELTGRERNNSIGVSTTPPNEVHGYVQAGRCMQLAWMDGSSLLFPCLCLVQAHDRFACLLARCRVRLETNAARWLLPGLQPAQPALSRQDRQPGERTAF